MDSAQPSQDPVKRITIIGNAAGGKTTLARQLGASTGLPVFHIDSIQFLPSLEIRPLDETRAELRKIMSQEFWILDGLGPFDLLIDRFKASDIVIFLDLPIWQHYFWYLKRQVTSLWRPRSELPPGSHEFGFQRTKKVLKTMRGIHEKMRPELLRILNSPEHSSKLIHLKAVKDISSFRTKIHMEDRSVDGVP